MKYGFKKKQVGNEIVYTISVPALTYEEKDFTEQEVKMRIKILEGEKLNKLNEISVIDEELEILNKI